MKLGHFALIAINATVAGVCLADRAFGPTLFFAIMALAWCASAICDSINGRSR